MKIRFHRRFMKDLRRCPVKVREQFRKRFQLFLLDPHHPLLENHALQGEWEHYRSINITGDYRALYRHVETERIEFAFIDTHSNLYE